jgi:transposase-like protein
MAQIRRTFTADFRESAVRLVRETGKPIAEAAEDLGVNARTLRSWVNVDKRRRSNGVGVVDESERADLVRLQLKSDELTIESDEPTVEFDRLQRPHGFRRGLTRPRSIPPLPPFILTLARCAVPLAALAIGLLSLTTARESAIGQYGLIQALPPLYFVSLVILAISFILAWRSPRPRFPELTLGVISLVVLLQSAPAIIESEPRFQVAWVHVGFADFVAQTGRILPRLDARFNWPSFFTGIAFLDRAGGLPNAIILIRWWSLFINLLYLPPLYLIAKTVLRDARKAMLAIWLFPFANWIGQDYYSPQSVAYLLYLVLLSVVLGSYGASRKAMIPRLRRKPGDSEQKKPPDEWRPQAPAHALTLLLVMLALCAALDTGHQLTPVFAIATVAVLVFFGRTRLLVWPGVMFLLAAGWVCYGAITFWIGHITALFGGLGSVGGNYAGDLHIQLHQSVAHGQVKDVRLLAAGLILGLAIVGFFVGRKMHADRTAAAVMMLTPLATISVQSYGTEAGLRGFLLSLPGTLCLVAMALTSADLRFRPILIGALTAALIPAFLIARWGNEIFERVLPGEVSAATALYRTAPHGSTIMTITGPTTLQFMDIAQYRYESANIDQFDCGAKPSPARLVNVLASQLRKNPHGGYLIITLSQLESAQTNSGIPIHCIAVVERKLTHSPLFRVIYSNPAGKIYQVVRRK